MAAATRRYTTSHEVNKQMQACAGSIAGREYFGVYQTVFSLEGVPQARQFVDRPAEMAQLERVLVPRPGQSQRQKIPVLRGLGGMGKTQLAVEFARRHHRQFSSVFWLDGRSEDTVKRSIASCASRIPQGQIPETSRMYAGDSGTDVDAVVRDVMTWLAQSDNITWLLSFDNVDREYKAQGGDPDAYDVKRYFSGADHGSVLVTTRLARLEQLGGSQQLGKVSADQAQAIFESWYGKKHDTAESEQLLAQLDGLPLAIAQAGAYLQESGDYPDRSVWTTWAISFQAICEKHAATANLLLLWSFLDNKDLWHGLFAAACAASSVAARLLSGWIGDIASSEVKFSVAMQLLRNYSLVEETIETTSYATHPVVHQWAHHSQVVTVGCSVPHSSARDYSTLQRRLLPHAQVCSRRLIKSETDVWLGIDKCDGGRFDGGEEQETVLDAVHLLGLLYAAQGKLGEAEQMYERALRGYEEAPGRDRVQQYRPALNTLESMGDLFALQGNTAEAHAMYARALSGLSSVLAK
ncbi:hypothetical protein EK21DRAFT_95617 [Setomelanomma holmii]|uniref:NB-ARC domain-containing protein n=1 Tax=Setomelanomma holmii TaxID=210430 RepID=A0A9P4GV50_9PLEO|nr:hypothetical protein EK21DRAFT_95617 [Setomelanomma holmii]